MPRYTKPPYNCPRCNFASNDRARMNRHFYKSKKTCQGIIDNTLVLTDEIKQCVLNNRIYLPKITGPYLDHHVPGPVIINNNNTFNIINYIQNMDLLTKVNTYQNYKKHIIKYYDSMEQKSVQHINIKDLQNGIGDVLSTKQIYGVMKSALETKIPEHLNMFYDNTNDTIIMFDSESYTTTALTDAFSGEIMQPIMDTIFEYYEIFIIRKHISSSGTEKVTWLDRLKEYYTFVCYMDVEPFIREDREDCEILENKKEIVDDDSEDGTTSEKSSIENENINETLGEKYRYIYQQVKWSVDNYDEDIIPKENCREHVVKIIKKSCIENEKFLNRTIEDLVQCDNVFKNILISV